MPRHRFPLIAALASLSMMAACAPSVPRSVASQAPAQPPRFQTPAWVLLPCQLPILPAEASQADLDLAYAARGEALIDCDTARAMAVDLLDRERRAQDEAQQSATRRRQSFWDRLLRR